MKGICKPFLILLTLLFAGCEEGTHVAERASTRVPSSEIKKTEAQTSRLTREFYKTEIEQLFSSDPLAKYQWHLFNTGQTNFSTYAGNPGKDIQAPQAITRSVTGSGIKIAVSDTGVELDHEDLIKNSLPEQSKNYSLRQYLHKDWIGDPSPVGKDIWAAHGTNVAGIIASTSGNGLGGRGIAPGAMIAGFRYLDVEPNSAIILDQTQGDFDIFNYSHGAEQCSFVQANKHLVKALQKGTNEHREGLGALYVKAAGNSWSGVLKKCLPSAEQNGKLYYANTNMEGINSYPYLIIAGAINARGRIASYSTPGSNLWVSAPGGEPNGRRPALMTTDLTGCDAGLSADLGGKSGITAFEFEHPLNLDCNYTSAMAGTSAATPVISGSIALILETNPNLSWRDVKHILAVTSDKVVYSEDFLKKQPYNLVPPLKGHDYQDGLVVNAAGYSFHNWFGFGSINVDKAIEMAKNYTHDLGEFVETFHPKRGHPIYDSGSLELEIPDNSAKGVAHSIEVKHNLAIEAIRIELSSDHPAGRDLGVELTSPSGTKSIILNVNSGIVANFLDRESMGSNAFYGESSLGKWTIKLIDGAKGNIGKLTNWKIGVYGHPFASAPKTTPRKVGRIFNSLYHDNLLSTPLFTWHYSEPENFLRYDISIGSAPGESDIVGWMKAPEDRKAQLSFRTDRIRFERDREYYFNVRAVDKFENRSLTKSSKWITSKINIE